MLVWCSAKVAHNVDGLQPGCHLWSVYIVTKSEIALHRNRKLAVVFLAVEFPQAITRNKKACQY